MAPAVTGEKYDKIASWWQQEHKNSDYGIEQIRRAISYCKHKESALDVGCGSGGRVTAELIRNGYQVTGIDVSENMVELAQAHHPEVAFQVQDIISWNSNQKYDLIIAWDSIFHLPLNQQAPVVAKLCHMLRKDGILIYTFGDAVGEHESNWRNDTFYYSSIGINGNLSMIMKNNCECKHLELDQYPLNHVYIISQKLE